MVPLENKCQDDCSYLCYTVTDMLSLDFIRLHPDVVREGLRRRGDAQDIDEILRLIEQRRGLVTRCDGLYAELKPLREQVRVAPEERREAINKQIKAKSRDIRLASAAAPETPGQRTSAPANRRHPALLSSAIAAGWAAGD